MTLTIDLINGVKFGLEYVSADPDEEGDVSLIVCDFAILRFILVIP